MTIQDIFMASAVLIGLLLGILLGWYGCLAYAKRKYVDNTNQPIVIKKKPKPTEKKENNESRSQEDDKGEVNLSRIIKDREGCSFTDFCCEENGVNSLETLRQNQQKSNSAYEYLKSDKKQE